MAKTRKRSPRPRKPSPDALVDRVVATREQLRNEARRRLGVTGEEKAPRLRDVLGQHKVSIYPLVALSTLGVVDTFQGYAFRVLAPEVSGSLGISKSAVATLFALSALASALGPLPIAALAAQKARRALLILVTAFAWSLVAISTGFVTALAGLAFVLVLDALTTASATALHGPVLLDVYPPAARVRALSAYVAAGQFGQVLAPLLVAVCTAVIGLTWRGTFVTLGVISLLAVFTALGLRDPGFGRWDSAQIRATVQEKDEGRASTELYSELSREFAVTSTDVELGFFEIVRRLTLIPTIRRLLAVEVVFGIFLIPYQTFIAFFLDERWNLGPGARGILTAFFGVISIVALALFGTRGEAMFRRDPARVLAMASWTIAAAVGFISLAALVPFFGLLVAFLAISSALLTVLVPATAVSLLSVIPSGMRPHAGALLGIAISIGGFAGALLLGGIDSQYGITGTIVSLVVPGLIGSLILRSTANLVPADLDRMIDETLEDEEIKQITASGGSLPMLACRKIDFSYGHVQVLFGVDFTVDDGEIVALLGTNGAGKSTLLKVVSGIGLPSGGSVRYSGADITYLDAERRLRLGITQIPGGRAVFGPMTVVENLRVFGYSLGNFSGGRRRREVDAAIDRSFAAFPRLGERRDQKASTLSGGEQQMLGLSKALMLRPRLLLVDELSLGLAPVIVAQLFEMVKEINREGTAVVLVEQSVNIALNLAEHAYFMEKGEIRFDGRSRDLLKRDDLLRAVFLEGASARSKRR